MDNKYLLKPAVLTPQVYFNHDEGMEWLELLDEFHISSKAD